MKRIYFTINNNRWTIKEMNAKVLLKKYREGVNDDVYFAFGVTIFPKHEIWINSDMCMEQKIRTLKHELTHCYIYTFGMYNIPNYSEEMVCDLVASCNDFITEITSKYLMKGDKKAYDKEKSN